MENDDKGNDECVMLPEANRTEKCFLGLLVLLIIIFSIYVAMQFCLHIDVLRKSITNAPVPWYLKECLWCTYLSLGMILFSFILIQWLRHKVKVHKARLEDQSEVESIIVEATTLEPRQTNPQKPENFEEKAKQIKIEIKRLYKIGTKGWTEYQILPLNQLLVDFLKIDDLKARAYSALEDLQEYADDDRYNEEHFLEWKNRIKEAVEKIDNSVMLASKVSDNPSQEQRSPEDPDDTAETLRGELRTLLEHVADYDKYWAEGSALIRSLMLCGIVATPIFLVMGLLPILHTAGSGKLAIINWGFLGVCGSITAVLLVLRKSDLVEVGNTRGKNELWRAVLAGVLGLIAGVLLYAGIAGELIAGSLFPTKESLIFDTKTPIEAIDLARSIFWGIASGMCFEGIFDWVKNKAESTS